jgi:hypothetical protein
MRLRERSNSYHTQGSSDRLLLFEFQRSGSTWLAASALAMFLLLPFMAQADDLSGAELEAVVRGLPPSGSAESVALCPDISESPSVFVARDGNGLAGALARAGYRVYLVDPWNSAAARAEGFDAVVRDVYPELLRKLADSGGGERVTWIGHGLCGMLPVAAAARPAGKLPEVRWVALGTRFSWTLPSPLLLRWLRTWQQLEPALPDLVRALLFTGLRARSGPRSSSAPSPLDPSGDPAEVLEAYHRDTVSRAPPRALVEDLLRWFDVGAARDREGWVDYGAGLAKNHETALLVAGATDPVSPPEDVLAGFRRLPEASSAQWLLLSRANGDLEEYGHLGMLLSRHSARDVDASLLRWLRKGKL